MGAAVAILLQVLDLIPLLTKKAAAIRGELQRSGEMTKADVEAVNAKWEAAFASDHWQKDVNP